MGGKRRQWLILILSLLCLAGLSVSSSGSALGDVTNNPDGSHTVTATFPNPPGFPCPSTFHGTTSTSLSAFVPRGARIVSHQLIFNPPCSGSGVTDSFNPDASEPPAAADDQTARDDFTVTCEQMGGCAVGSVSVTLEVTYFDPVPPPLPSDVVLPKKVGVDPQSGKGELRIHTNGATPLAIDRPALLRQKGHSPCSRTDHVPLNDARPLFNFKLNDKCLKTLDGKGKLTVRFDATLRNSAGSVPFTRKLKLVKKK